MLVLLSFTDVRTPWIANTFVNSLFAGVYTDFNSDWFGDAGIFLLITYKVQILFPIMEFAMKSLIRMIKRCCDQKKIWPNDVNRTNAPTIGKFVDLYLGQ
jgi:hypothetical protein